MQRSGELGARLELLFPPSQNILPWIHLANPKLFLWEREKQLGLVSPHFQRASAVLVDALSRLCTVAVILSTGYDLELKNVNKNLELVPILQCNKVVMLPCLFLFSRQEVIAAQMIFY